ncbi:MAG: hypothetical protein WC356_04590 [Candidatus Micrarchaeia archaeon]|jgi:hypothetical protein
MLDLELEFLDYELAENIPNGGVLIALSNADPVILDDDGEID